MWLLFVWCMSCPELHCDVDTLLCGDRYKEENKISQSLPAAGTSAVLHSSSAKRCRAYLGFHAMTHASQELLSKSVFGQLRKAFYRLLSVKRTGKILSTTVKTNNQIRPTLRYPTLGDSFLGGIPVGVQCFTLKIILRNVVALNL